ncbi:hypothetical protein ACMZ5F_25165 [Streptomyces rhizosphaericola]|uniref:hypothetical protein n=1 Tax=Streptomyces rhizosphaericola TaxID=2564098 RepID=UPI0039EEA4AA
MVIRSHRAFCAGAAERQLRDRLREPEERFADGRRAVEELWARASAQEAAASERLDRTA